MREEADFSEGKGIEEERNVDKGSAGGHKSFHRAGPWTCSHCQVLMLYCRLILQLYLACKKRYSLLLFRIYVLKKKF